MQQIQSYDYLILGAGISGLQSALILAQNRKTFLIIEASNVLGGRICTETLGEVLNREAVAPSMGVHVGQPAWAMEREGVLGVPVQVGATWIAESHQCMFRMLKEFGLEYFQQDKKGVTVFGISPTKYEYHQNFHHFYDKQTKKQIKSMLSKFHTLQTKFHTLYQQAVEKQYHDKLDQYNNFINKYDSISLQEFIMQELKDQELVGELMNFVECLQCVGCDRVSVLQVLDDEECLDIVWEAVWEDGEGEGEEKGESIQSDDGYRVKTGMLSVIKAMFNKIYNLVSNTRPTPSYQSIIRFNEPVTKIETWPNKSTKLCRVHVRTPTGTKIYEAKRVLNSIPIAVMSGIEINNLSIGKQLLFGGQEWGDVQRVYLVFRERFWKPGFSGYGSFGGRFPFNQMTDITPFNEKCGILVLVFYAGKYEKWLKTTPDPLTRLQYLKTTIANMLLKGNRESPHLATCFIYTRTFRHNPYIRAGYQSVPKMGTWKAVHNAGEDYEQAFTRDENGVYYIGNQFAEDEGSYMEGSVRLARKKVYQLLSVVDPWK